jgi:hypothetical protein
MSVLKTSAFLLQPEGTAPGTKGARRSVEAWQTETTLSVWAVVPITTPANPVSGHIANRFYVAVLYGVDEDAPTLNDVRQDLLNKGYNMLAATVSQVEVPRSVWVPAHYCGNCRTPLATPDYVGAHGCSDEGVDKPTNVVRNNYIYTTALETRINTLTAAAAGLKGEVEFVRSMGITAMMQGRVDRAIGALIEAATQMSLPAPATTSVTAPVTSVASGNLVTPATEGPDESLDLHALTSKMSNIFLSNTSGTLDPANGGAGQNVIKGVM